MLLFKKVRYKNFQSVGNTFITIDLDRSPTTVIGGQNGAGKSTMLEAVSYGLFGKPLKKLTLAQLINTINRKALVVEIEFTKNGKEYKIVRGQKPAVLEFWIDGEMQDQSAKSSDYQAKIEYVLGMDFKLFTQVVVLNKEKYTPFMDLGAADRRKVVEDILDISVFSVMSDLQKSRARTLSSEIEDLKFERERLQERMRGQQRLIDEAASNVDGQVQGLRDDITGLETEKDGETSKLTDIDTRLVEFEGVGSKVTAASAKKRQFEDVAVKFQANIKELERTASFFKDNDVCPTCSQPIDDEIKRVKHDECNTKVSGIKESAANMVSHYQLAVATLNDLVATQQAEQELQRARRTTQDAIARIDREIASKRAAIARLSVESKVDQYRQELQSSTTTFDTMTDGLEELKQKEVAQARAKDLLKDDGIKASIVRDYIEFINTRVNEYLGAMDFFIGIALNEKFEDKITSINREGFTYDNLSTGQKSRVNLAIWLALLEVAAIKNSVVTNLLALDEVMENLDSEGVSSFMKLVREKLPHRNCFVITQRFSEFRDHFRTELQFRLKDGFTEIAV
ncbi:hypothetical protein pf16_95 [Pseudomonas phage pf16]|uniref:Rad50/SbcC-type AAA domain-containing protein n=1 Tax=Pseudomonas phage pf16 TaxID=1815630 RepID=A0A1S5R3N7_9CAUD|nr:hypothetical protein FDG98_gp203 [Pseudomonas phage pf16]AND75018.1 hypothetical protein pf16_95 [Pseudomonas phage pf16]